MILVVFATNLSLFEPLPELLSDCLISFVNVVRFKTPPTGLLLPVIVMDIYVELDYVSSISDCYWNLSAISLCSSASGATEYLLLNANRVDLTDCIIEPFGTFATADFL